MERPKVILTRQKEDIEKDKEIFERLGMEVLPLPLIKIEPLDFKIPEEAPDYIVFQSKNAVKFFLRKIKIPENVKVVAVGEKTKKFLEKQGIKVYKIPEVQNAKGLCELFKGLPSGSVWIPRSEIGREEIIECLESFGFKVFPINAYRTVCEKYKEEEVERTLKTGNYIVFASPSSVDCLFANLQKDKFLRVMNNLKIVAIGKTTKNKLEEEGLRVDIIPDKPSMEEVAVKIHEHWQEICSL